MGATTPDPKAREKVIVRTGILGVAANLLLAGFKALVGFWSKSIAVQLDAVNNLSDALSSVITILGAKISGKKPDKEHPLGHGRVEYISSMLIAALVLYAGIAALTESVKKILHPEAAEYSMLSLAIIVVAAVVKVLMGLYVRNTGLRMRSDALKASGKDALFDAVLSASVLLSAVLYLRFGWMTEAYVGVVIALLIIRSGVEMLRDAYDEILGKRVDREFLTEIRKTICEDEAVRGAYDLLLHSYGPDKYVGSVHVEVEDTMTADQIDRMERRITDNVYLRHGVVMTGIGIYAANLDDDAVGAIRMDVTRRILAHEGVLQIHGFYADIEKREIRLDVILDFALEDRSKTYAEICREIEQTYPEYRVRIVLDLDT